MKNIFLLLFLFLINGSVTASSDSLWQAYDKNPNTPVIANYLLKKYDTKENLPLRDSAFAVFLKNNAFQKYEIRNKLYENYFFAREFSNIKITLLYAKEWCFLNEKYNNYSNTYIAYKNLLNIVQLFKENEDVDEIATKELKYAILSGNKIYKIEALFDKAKSFEQENNKTESFQNYLDAYYNSLEINNIGLQEKSLSHISFFFSSNKLYDKANKYKQQEIDLYLKNNKPCDSNKYFSLLSQLSDNLFDHHETEKAVVYSDKILSFCIRKGNQELFHNQLTILRSYYFDANDFDGLIDFYTIKFPFELDSLRKSNRLSYYRIISLIKERKSETKAAILYLDSAELCLTNSDYAPLMAGHFYIRKGEFYLRQNRPLEAISYFDKAFGITYPKKYFPFLKTIAQSLDTAYSLLGNYKLAHFYRGLTLAYTDSLKAMINNDAIMLLEVDNVEKQKELLQVQNEALVNRKHNLQYMLIVILIATSFIMLIIFSSVKIPELVIRGLGYFVFIFFFEFIILLADNKIHHMTHGEPLKIMGLKIILIGMLLPLHHWVEHKVVHYLLHHKILAHFRINVWAKTKLLIIMKPQPIIVIVEEPINEHIPHAPYNEHG